jgi:hypothetical protein
MIDQVVFVEMKPFYISVVANVAFDVIHRTDFRWRIVKIEYDNSLSLLEESRCHVGSCKA